MVHVLWRLIPLVEILKKRKNFKCIKPGSGGNGPLLNLATLREYLPNKKVKEYYTFILREQIFST